MASTGEAMDEAAILGFRCIADNDQGNYRASMISQVGCQRISIDPETASLHALLNNKRPKLLNLVGQQPCTFNHYVCGGVLIIE